MKLLRLTYTILIVFGSNQGAGKRPAAIFSSTSPTARRAVGEVEISARRAESLKRLPGLLYKNVVKFVNGHFGVCIWACSRCRIITKIGMNINLHNVSKSCDFGIDSVFR